MSLNKVVNVQKTNYVFNPLYTYELFFLVWYNKLGIVD